MEIAYLPPYGVTFATALALDQQARYSFVQLARLDERRRQRRVR